MAAAAVDHAFGALGETARTRERGHALARGNRRPLASQAERSRGRRLHPAQAMTTSWLRTSRRWRAGCSARSSPRATSCASIETTGQPAVTSAQVPRAGSPRFRPRAPRSWPKPTGNGGNPRVSRPIACVRSACKPRHSARPLPVPENRGVPGSSPGLATSQRPCKAGLFVWRHSTRL